VAIFVGNEMKQIVVEKPGGYSSFVIKTRNSERAPHGHYNVGVKYIGVNYADVIIREGYYTAAKGLYPLVPGFEYSGVILDVGEGCKEFGVGDEICGVTLFGGYSTEIVAKESSMRRLPEGWKLEEAAALLVPNLTAYHAINNVAHMKGNETILIHSAAGGVGSALLQQAKELGCRTIAVVGRPEKKAAAEQYGASHVIVKSDLLWAEVDRIAPGGIDVVFDANGLTTPKPGYDRLKLGGRLVIYGFAELFPRGKRPWLPTLAYRSLKVPKFRIRKMTSTNRTIAGFNIAFLFEREDLSGPALDYIVKSASSGSIQKPPIRVFDFNEVIDAHKHLESGDSIGRVVLAVH
jgi:synaptic vesicle membrane protein VAT-1